MAPKLRTLATKVNYFESDDDDADSDRDSHPSPPVYPSYPPANLRTPNTPKTSRSRTASAVASQDFQRTPYNHGSERRDSGPSPTLLPPSQSPTVPVFTTPARMRSTTASVVASQRIQQTPSSRGAASVAGYQEGVKPDAAKKYRDNYKSYLKEDLAAHRVLVDEDAFLEVVYNISRKERLGQAHTDLLKKISDDTTFKKAWNAYANWCKRVGSGKRPEKKLYKPRVDVYNAALAVLDKLDSGEKERIRFYVNDPARLKHGVYGNGLSVDLGQVSESLFGKEITPSLGKNPLGAAMLLGAEELKATSGCLITGQELMYRAMNLNGRAPEVIKDPIPSNSKGGLQDGRAPKVNDDPFCSDSEGATQDGRAFEVDDDPFASNRARALQQQPVSGAPDSSDDDKPTISQPSGAKKRKIGLKSSSSSTNKVSRLGLGKSKELPPKYEAADDEVHTPEKLRDVQVQCASYAMETLSLTPLRSHFIMTLVDRTDLQLMYFDSSVMLVTPPIHMKTEEGKNLFLSMLVGLHRMSLPDRGVRDLIIDNEKFFTRLDFFGRQLKNPPHWRNMLTGMILKTQKGLYRIKDILFRQAGIVGRLTYVVRAKKVDPENSNVELEPSVVIKISLPSVSRTSEETLVAQARKAAEDESGEEHWVLKHLPKILHSEDIGIVKDSTQDRVAHFIQYVAQFEGAKYPYEYRVLRIVVLEELFPISTLREPSQHAQVFFDILNCHKWLHDNPRILHRDISMSNIMYRLDDDHNVYGVLNDMDLSSDLNDLEDLKATSLRRTGTPPFMAIDLLGKDSHQPEHIYRHDLESLFYVMLILFARYEFIAAEPNDDRGERLVKRHKAPLSEWFDPTLSWDTLAEKKQYFITNIPPVTSSLHMNHILSSSFQGFKPWISRLKNALQDGLGARNRALRDLEEALESGEVPPSFAYETLGGKVQYSTFFDVMKNFGGKVLRAPPYSLDITATTSLQPTLSTTAV